MEVVQSNQVDLAIAQLAASQSGVVTRHELAELGLTASAIDRRCRKGVLRRLHAGVYAHAAVPPSRLQTLLAVLRWAGPGNAASHRAAAHLWKLDGFEELLLEGSGPKRIRSERILWHWGSAIPMEDLTTIDGVPVTKIERTLLDVAAVEDLDRLEDALDSALRRRLTSIKRMQLRLRTETKRRGVGKLRSLLAERDGEGRPSESRFETRFNRLLLHSGLPAFRQFKIWNGGDLVALVDFCFPDAKVIVEADGYRWHSSRRAWQRDRERRNELTALGWTVIQVTWDDVTRRSAQTVERLRGLLQPQLPI